MLDQPIFIVSAVRSGSTLLAACMDKHDDITWVQTPAGGTELNQEWRDLSGLDFAATGVDCPRCGPASAGKVTPDVRARVREGFERLHAERDPGGQSRFLNKNPHLWNKLPFLRAVFPDARVVVISRDIRSTVLSTQMLWLRAEKLYGVRHYLPIDSESCWSCSPPALDTALHASRLFPGGSVRVLAEYWIRVHETLSRELADFDHPLFVRHRDLVADPLGVLAHLYQALNLPASGAELPVIDPGRNQRWHGLLAASEQEELKVYIEEQRHRIRVLRQADATLSEGD